ncbi:hypothetical protein BV53_04995 [Candidatus Synechococcus spongiarum LMB bulk15N]|uniref:J domain-containing protein n=1 Tax=Candidatus Synechococcus spongiarum LMB bulk15N TaxID=1943583 RepID=A0A1T1D1T9_9SYNE|nr:hypothetical protein BV53_04995 [Candidatus Synechococcus spongiarum LMB bulk15N]
MADYYDLLNVSRDADPETLKRAYRRLARQYHPDVNKEPGAEERFKEIGRAYEVLSDPEKRARYDQFGEAGVGGAAGGMPDMGDIGGFADLFESFFGGGGGNRPRITATTRTNPGSGPSPDPDHFLPGSRFWYNPGGFDSPPGDLCHVLG